MNIAYLTNHRTSLSTPASTVHVSQIAKGLLGRGHVLYTNLMNESARFIRLSPRGFLLAGQRIDLFYIRIHGTGDTDELTMLRKANPTAPCVWEINAPLEELRKFGIPEEDVRKKTRQRKRLAKMVNAAICVSAEMEQYAREELAIQRTFVVPNGSDPAMFNPAKRDPNLYGTSKFKVIWAGSAAYPWQGLHIVKKVAKRLKHIDPDILVIATANGNSSENMFYIGKIPYHTMPVHMASADVGLCIYEHIDFYHTFFFSPLKLYDYMASALPVIGSNVGQIGAVLENYQNGLLTDTSVDSIVDNVLQLKRNQDLAQKMGFKGRQAIIDQHNWNSVVRQYESILLQAIGECNACAVHSSSVTQRSRRSEAIKLRLSQMTLLFFLIVRFLKRLSKMGSKASPTNPTCDQLHHRGDVATSLIPPVGHCK
ncbi:MAG: glycosyltransferase [Thermodesulfobacteriota bacterium]|nr:glycosyltransferase [Thermodesulfobacteriota bacterium]